MSGIVVHKIFVKYGDKKSNELSLRLLRYIKKNLVEFKELEIKFEVKELSVRDLERTATKQLLRSNNVQRLPALVTVDNVYHGADTIIDAYTENIKQYRRALEPPPRPPPRRNLDTQDNLVERFFESAIHDDNVDWNEEHMEVDFDRQVSSRFAAARQQRDDMRRDRDGSSGQRNRERSLLLPGNSRSSRKSKSTFIDEPTPRPPSAQLAAPPPSPPTRPPREDNIDTNDIDAFFNRNNQQRTRSAPPGVGGRSVDGDFEDNFETQRDEDLLSRYMESTPDI